MEKSKNILLITNSATDEEISLVKNTFEQAAKQGLRIKLSLVHVIPSLPTCYFNIPSMAQLAEQYYTEAKNCLVLTGEALNVAKKDQWLITGRLKTEVLRLASKLSIQFILASSSNIHDLHKMFIPNRPNQSTQVKNIDNLATANWLRQTFRS